MLESGDWRMVVVVEGGNVLNHVKRGELSGRGKCVGNMSGGICPRGNVRIPTLEGFDNLIS